MSSTASRPILILYITDFIFVKIMHPPHNITDNAPPPSWPYPSTPLLLLLVTPGRHPPTCFVKTYLR